MNQTDAKIALKKWKNTSDATDYLKQTEQEEEEEEEDEEEDEEEEEEEVFEIEIDDITYYATDEDNGPIYKVDDDVRTR